MFTLNFEIAKKTLRKCEDVQARKVIMNETQFSIIMSFYPQSKKLSTGQIVQFFGNLWVLYTNFMRSVTE